MSKNFYMVFGTIFAGLMATCYMAYGMEAEQERVARVIKAERDRSAQVMKEFVDKYCPMINDAAREK